MRPTRKSIIPGLGDSSGFFSWADLDSLLEAFLSAFLSAFLTSFSAFLSFFAATGSVAGVVVITAGSEGLRDVAARDLVTASTLAPDLATIGRALIGRSFLASLYSYPSISFLEEKYTAGISWTSERAIGPNSPRS